MVAENGASIHGKVVSHAFRVPDDGQYEVRTTVRSVLGGGSKVAIDLGQNETIIASVVDANGRTITALSRDLLGGGAGTAGGFLIAHLANGQIDRSFGVNGTVSLDRYFPTDLQIDASGRIVVATAIGSSSIVSRWTSQGVLDTTFASQGQWFYNATVALAPRRWHYTTTVA